MKILFTNFRLAARSGSECVTLELAGGLRDRGHDVAVYTPERGPLAEQFAAEKGVPVVDEPGAAPFAPDVIHGQHGLPTSIALLAFPCAPALYYCHGYLPPEERPPTHPRIRRWLAPSSRFQAWFKSEFGIPPERFVLSPTFVDPQRFQPGPIEAARRGAALLYHSNLVPGRAADAVREACDRETLRFQAVGGLLGPPTDSPDTLLPGTGIVFSSGRSALEALACGCAVIPVSDGRIAPAVSLSNFAGSLDRNFTATAEFPAIELATVRDAIRGVNWPDLAALSQKVRTELSLGSALELLERVYAEVAAEGPFPPDAAADVRHLRHALSAAAAILAEKNRSVLRWREVAAATKADLRSRKEELVETKRRLSEADSKLKQLRVSLRRGILGRRWLKKHDATHPVDSLPPPPRKDENQR